jgi:hypothetical protein
VRLAVARVIKDLPAPENGKDADPEVIRRQVADAIETLPKPRDGLDAMQIVVQSGIEPTRRYQRGTYASYRGGTVVAFRETDPLHPEGPLEKSGWQVVLNGIHHEEERQLDEGRVIQRITDYTNGTRMVSTHKRAVAIYRKTFKSTSKYVEGDMVTYGGSVWHCNATSPTSLPPGNGSSLWTLSVKRGADGKALINDLIA